MAPHVGITGSEIPDRWTQATGLSGLKRPAFAITCGKMIALLKRANERKKELIAEGRTCMDEEELRKIFEEYEHIINEELQTFWEKNPNLKKKYVPEYIKTLKRMKEYEKEHLRFLTDFKVPFTNNPAENSIRFLKSKKKISGQFINLES